MGVQNIVIIDDQTDSQTWKEQLSNDFPAVYSFVDCHDSQTMLDECTLQLPDAVLINLHFNELEPLHLINLLRMNDITRNVPIVVIGNAGHELIAVQAIEAGADEYVVKAKLQAKHLHFAILNAIEKYTIYPVADIKTQTTAMISNTNAIAGFASRYMYEMALAQSLARARRHHRHLAVLMIVIENFGDYVNQHHINLIDELLTAIALRLQTYIRQGDMVARYGEQEFVLLLDELADFYDAGIVANRIIQVIRAPFIVGNQQIQLRASIGIACYPLAGKTVIELNERAGDALKQALQVGGNRYYYYTDELNRDKKQVLTFANALQLALEDEQFYLVYQPIVDLKTEKVVALESLLRWHHPTIGEIFPNEFIYLAEKSGLIVDIGLWVLQTACKQFIRLKKMGLPLKKVYVNVSARQLEEKSFVRRLEQIINEVNIAPQELGIELTETALLKNLEASMALLSQLHERGINIAIDDFGTGYFSLSFIKKLSFNSLKIDRSFVNGLGEDKVDEAIVESVLCLIQNLDIDIVAEGIETSQQLDFLKAKHCPLGQGYHFSKPLIEQHLIAFLQNQRT